MLEPRSVAHISRFGVNETSLYLVSEEEGHIQLLRETPKHSPGSIISYVHPRTASVLEMNHPLPLASKRPHTRKAVNPIQCVLESPLPTTDVRHREHYRSRW